MNRETQSYQLIPESHRYLRNDVYDRPLGYVFPRDDGSSPAETLKLCLYVGEQALMQIVDKQRLRLSCPWRTNDITECVAQAETYQTNIIKNFGYICLSSVWDSPKMWGLYAERSRGACLIFEFEVIKLDEETYEILDDGKSVLNNRLLIRKVRYSDIRAKGGDIDILFRKSTTWDNEHEYRILFNLESGFSGDVETSQTSDGVRIDYYHSELLRYLRVIALGPKCKYNEVEIRALISSNIEKVKMVGYQTKFFSTICRSYIPVISRCIVIRAEIDSEKFNYKVCISSVYSAQENMKLNAKMINTLCTEKWMKKDMEEVCAVCKMLNCRLESTYASQYCNMKEEVVECFVVRVLPESGEYSMKYIFLEHHPVKNRMRLLYELPQTELAELYVMAQSEAGV